MLWTDIAFDCDVSNDQLRRAWATVFDVGPEAIAIINDITLESPWTDPRARIGLERRPLSGDFPMQIMAIVRGAELEARIKTADQSLDVIRRLCAELNCQALISTEDINPYEWMLITPTGQVETVAVDPDQLGDHDAFVLAKASTTTR